MDHLRCPDAWPRDWREQVWAQLARPWDLVVVGGGITGAGIFAVAARHGLRALLLERRDFASGTSSRSSKLVHGGLRYLKQGRLRLTRDSVHERQHLLEAAPGLVEPLSFVHPLYRHDAVKPWVMSLGLAVYTRLAPGAGGFDRMGPAEAVECTPGLDPTKLVAAFRFTDAQTDDARLVLRVIRDAVLASAGRCQALSYAEASALVSTHGRVAAVVVRDLEGDREIEAPARLVVNATGAWADRLRVQVGMAARLRPLRGSHLFFALEDLPLRGAVSFSHPEDGRPVFAYPWQGVALVGTTDVDHRHGLDIEPSISVAETDYLMAALDAVLPGCGLEQRHIISTQAGVRPVIDTGRKDPSTESREHLLVAEEGMLSVIGGKLTTFRLVALEVMRAARGLDPSWPRPDPATAVFAPGDAIAARSELDSGASEPIAGTAYCWNNLLWSAEHEAVVHLADLLLRRFRFGILLGSGCHALVPRLEDPLRQILGWNAVRWRQEVTAFTTELQAGYGVPA